MSKKETKEERGLYEAVILTAYTYEDLIRLDDEEASKVREYAEEIGRKITEVVNEFLAKSSSSDDFVRRVEAYVLASMGSFISLTDCKEYSVKELMTALSVLFYVATKEKGKEPVGAMAEEMARIVEEIRAIKRKSEKTDRKEVV